MSGNKKDFIAAPLVISHLSSTSLQNSSNFGSTSPSSFYSADQEPMDESRLEKEESAQHWIDKSDSPKKGFEFYSQECEELRTQVKELEMERDVLLTVQKELEAAVIERDEQNEKLSSIIAERTTELLELKQHRVGKDDSKLHYKKKTSISKGSSVGLSEEKFPQKQTLNNEKSLSDEEFKKKLNLQLCRHEQETESLSESIAQLKEELETAKALQGTNPDTSREEVLSNLEVELDKLRETLQEQEATSSKYLDELQTRYTAEIEDLQSNFEAKKDRLETQLESLTERESTKREECKKLTSQVTETITTSNLDLEKLENEVESLNKVVVEMVRVNTEELNKLIMPKKSVPGGSAFFNDHIGGNDTPRCYPIKKSLSEGPINRRKHKRSKTDAISDFSSKPSHARRKSTLNNTVVHLRSRIRQIESIRETETGALSNYIESLTRVRDDQKRTIDQLKEELRKVSVKTDNITNERGHKRRKSKGEENINEEKRSDKDISGANDKDEKLDDEALRKELDSAKWTVRKLSNDLKLHISDSQALHNQIQNSEENSMELSTKEEIAMINRQIQVLRNHLLGEAKLRDDINKLRVQVGEAMDKNKELEEQLKKRKFMYSKKVKNITARMKDKIESDSRLIDIEDQLHSYHQSLESSLIDTDTDQPPSITPSLSEDNTAYLESLKNSLLQEKEKNVRIMIQLQAAEVAFSETLKTESTEFFRKKDIAERSVDIMPAPVSLAPEYTACGSRIPPEPSVSTKGAAIGAYQRRVQDQNAMIKKLHGQLQETGLRYTGKLKRVRRAVKAKSMSLQGKNVELEELYSKLEAVEVDNQQKVEYLEDILQEREMALSQLRDQSELQIKNLQEELIMKDNNMHTEKGRLEREVERLRAKALKLERQLFELGSEGKEFSTLQKEISRLSMELSVSRGETMIAYRSKIKTVAELALEIERLRSNPYSFISLKNNRFPKLDREFEVRETPTPSAPPSTASEKALSATISTQIENNIGFGSWGHLP